MSVVFQYYSKFYYFIIICYILIVEKLSFFLIELHLMFNLNLVWVFSNYIFTTPLKDLHCFVIQPFDPDLTFNSPIYRTEVGNFPLLIRKAQHS